MTASPSYPTGHADRPATPPSVLVVDDDPTGSQVIRGLTVHFGEHGLSRLAFEPGDTEFLLTNSRSLDAVAARRISEHVGEFVAERRATRSVVLVSRSDSTLRGHIREEVDGLVGGLRSGGFDGGIRRIFCPAYIAAGRITRDDVQLCRSNLGFVPVTQTPFARDPVFAYTSSDLRAFLEERELVRGSDDVASIGLDMVREGDVDAIVRLIRDAGDGWVVANATEERDLDVIAQVVLSLADRDTIPIVRGGPSIVRALAGQPVPPRLKAREITEAFGRRDGHGLVVVGSHVPLASAQLRELLDQPHLVGVEVEARRAMAADPDHLRSVVERVANGLRDSDVVLWTSRRLIDDGEGLDAGRRVSDFVVDAVRRVSELRMPAWLIAKGGITSHEVAASALGIRSARIVGQLLDGQVSLACPVDAPEAVRRLPYVVFAGNVGATSSLADVRRLLALALAPGSSDAPPHEPPPKG